VNESLLDEVPEVLEVLEELLVVELSEEVKRLVSLS
jgi:hypothetical protein